MIKYFGLSNYTVNSSRGYQLGNQYLKLSIQALKEDDRELKIRNMKSRLVEILFEKLKEKI